MSPAPQHRPAPKIGRRVVSWLGHRIPRLGAFLDRQRPETFEGWDRGLNGQRARQRMVKEVVRATGVDAFVETGTFRGRTAAYIREMFQLPVWTVELVPRSYELCRWRFRDDPDVHLHLGDSRPFLRSMTSTLASRRCLFYLDAHWYDDLPLADELRIIASGWSEWVAIVDDFKVEDDHKYYFDDYGPGRSLELANLPLDALSGAEVWFPSTPGLEENFPWRGCVVIGQGEQVRTALAGCSTLRPRLLAPDSR